ncbi:MAG: TonB-dependent receptor [Phenylobacterium sp.]|nr:TonB-dependent receptor [Phenylobacterium sp.]
MRRPATWLAAVAVLTPLSALAQAPPPAKAPPAQKSAAAPTTPAGKTVEGLTVTGQGAEFRSSIDRRSYDVTHDLQTTTGSIADALRNVPSVDVDLNGNVSLRGDANVTIMIDGKPSGMFRGPGAAQALQSLPASQIERVEVITNPSAAYTPEGSAGIINLVTKTGRGVGASGSVRANVGGAGRRNLSVSGSYNADKLTLSGDAGWRHDPQHSVGVDDRVSLDPITGRRVTARTTNDFDGPLTLWNARAGADYDLGAATRLSGELRHNDFKTDFATLRTLRAFDPAGVAVQIEDLPGEGLGERANTAGQLNFRRKFAGDDHTFTANLSRERTLENNDERYTTLSQVPVLPDLFQSIRGRNTLLQTELKADYNRPAPAEGRLKVGYDLRIDDNDYDNRGLKGPNAATALNDARQTNRFLYKQTVNAAYVTYEQPFGDWTVLGGLRLEDVKLDLNQVTSALVNHQSYLRAYPSLHLGYKLSDSQQLSLSYSHRVQRPNPQDLNAFRLVGAFSARQGNANLRPQDTHSFEAGWQYKSGGTFYLATLYYRLNEHGVTDVTSDLGGGVLLTTKDNLSRSRNAGLELVANGRLTKTLSYNASTNLYWNEIDASGLGFAGKRSAFTAGGRASLNWQATPKDLFQVSAQLAAKRLLPQGFVEPMFLVFAGYRHKFSDSLSGVITTQDPFDIYRFRQVIDTPTLHEHGTGRGRIQSAFVGLTWSFGAATKKPQSFDFSGAQ